MKSELGLLLKSAFESGTHSQESNTPENQPPELKPGERRDAAVLFLDLAGFTELSETLDHETVHDIAKSIMDQLVLTAKQFTGYVDKIEGDRIMVLFGAVVSGENDSLRAVQCGFRMLEVLSLASSVLESSGVKLSSRIGISSGPVTVAPDAIGHLTAMGNTVNMASRMEQLADLNTIFVTDRVHSMCRDQAVWDTPREVKVKGISAPVTAWIPTAKLRPVCAVYQDTPFVGRKEEYTTLAGILGSITTSETGRAPDGCPKHVTVEITGDAGTGKARLASEFLCNECSEWLVLRGRSIPHGQPAHWLWSSVICSLLGFQVQKTVSWNEFTDKLSKHCQLELLKDSLPFIGRLIPSHTDDPRFTALGKQAMALETNLGIRDLLSELASKRPLALLLEDTQWMDTTDLKVLNFVLKNCRTENPILFILTGRDSGDSSPVKQLREENLYSIHRRIHLGEFSRSEAGELASAIAGRFTENTNCTFTEHAQDLLLDHSSGNPFFLQELVLHLLESGSIQLKGGIWRITDSSLQSTKPESLTGLLQSRLDNLPESNRSVLMLCAVLGNDFLFDTYRMVTASLGVKPEESDVFDELVDKQMLEPQDSGGMSGYRFRHPLIQRTAYENNLAHNLKLIHRAAAESMEELFYQDEERISAKLAAHWEGAGNISSASKWGLIAQKHASDNYQHTTVLHWGEKLLKWLPDNSADHMKVLERNASAYQFTGRSDEQRAAFQQILHLSMENEMYEWQARAEMNLGSFCRSSGDMEGAQEHLDRAMDICLEMELKEVQSNTLGNLGVLAADRGEIPKAGEYFTKARELHSELGNKRGEASTLGNLGIMMRNMRKPEEAVEQFERALDIFREIGDVRSEAITLGNLGNIHHDLKQLEITEKLYTDALRLFEKIGDRRSQGVFLGNLGILSADRNLDDTAVSFYQRALAISRETGNLRSKGWTLSNMGFLRLRQENFTQAFDLCSTALELFRKVRDRRMEAITLGAVGYLEILLGKTEESVESFKTACEMIEQMRLPKNDFENTLIKHREQLMKAFPEDTYPLPANWDPA